MISGKEKSVHFALNKFVGIANCKVISVNPDREEIESVCDYSPMDDKWFEYVGEKENEKGEKIRTLRIDFWVSAKLSSGEALKNRISFYIDNVPFFNKDGTKQEFINEKGFNVWCESIKEIPSWYKYKEIRPSKKGESSLYNFLRYWLSGIDYKDPDTIVSLDMDKMFSGDFSELKEQVGGKYSNEFLAMFYVSGKRNEDGTYTFYQRIWNKDFLYPGSMKFFNLINFNDLNVIEKLEEKDFKKMEFHEKFVYNIAISPYKCDGIYHFGSIKEFDEEAYIKEYEENAPSVTDTEEDTEEESSEVPY